MGWVAGVGGGVAGDASLEARVNDAVDGSASLVDLLPAELPSSDEEVDASRRRERLGEAVQVITRDLSKRERFIMENRLMADAESRMSLVAIGRHFGVSRERARQIESSLKLKLRNRITQAVHQDVLPTAA